MAVSDRVHAGYGGLSTTLPKSHQSLPFPQCVLASEIPHTEYEPSTPYGTPCGTRSDRDPTGPVGSSFLADPGVDAVASPDVKGPHSSSWLAIFFGYGQNRGTKRSTKAEKRTASTPSGVGGGEKQDRKKGWYAIYCRDHRRRERWDAGRTTGHKQRHGNDREEQR